MWSEERLLKKTKPVVRKHHKNYKQPRKSFNRIRKVSSSWKSETGMILKSDDQEDDLPIKLYS